MSSESSSAAAYRYFDDPERLTVRFQKLQVETIDAIVDAGEFADRSKAIREGIDLLLEDGGRGNEVRLDTSRKVTFYLPKSVLEDVEALADQAVYPNRSAAIRDGAEYLFEKYEQPSEVVSR